MRIWWILIAAIIAVAWYADYRQTERGYDDYEACEKAHQFEHAAELVCPHV